MKRTLLGVLAVGAALVAGSASHAQSMPWISPAYVQTYTRMDPTSQLLEQLKAKDNQARAATRAVAPLNARYVHSAARTQTNLRTFIARTPDLAARANLEQMLAAQPKIIDDIAAGVRAYGFDPHNVADAYAVWWINVWGTSEKRNIEPDAATVAAVKRQVYAAFAAAPDFARSSDGERQEYAEALLLQASMLGSAFEQTKSDPKMLDQLAEAARKGAKAQGLDLPEITLTPSGFVPRKGR